MNTLAQLSLVHWSTKQKCKSHQSWQSEQTNKGQTKNINQYADSCGLYASQKIKNFSFPGHLFSTSISFKIHLDLAFWNKLTAPVSAMSMALPWTLWVWAFYKLTIIITKLKCNRVKRYVSRFILPTDPTLLVSKVSVSGATVPKFEWLNEVTSLNANFCHLIRLSVQVTLHDQNLHAHNVQWW